MEEFQNKNPESAVFYERDSDKAITSLFICPAIMNNKLRFVRPVISLDAAHLSSENKGTLYLATIKSGNDEILPIAIGMTIENENYKGWKYFLNHLKTSCGVLTINHRFARCHPFKLFTFISDRDKGLLPAIQELFPENHQTNCQFHIRANAIQTFGLKVGNLVQKIGKTFSLRREQKLLHDLKVISPKASEYIAKIPPETWRNTEWLKNNSLPPRYGIVTSNNSESANSMFKDARSFTWLYALDKMLHIIMLKIANLRKIYKDKKGMIPSCERHYKKMFDTSANYRVTAINEDLSTYKVYKGVGNDYNYHESHEINMENKTCTCGYWQDTELLCVHAMAYYRIIEEKNLKEIFDLPFCQYYSYQYLYKLYKENINPVIIEVLPNDNETKPPPINRKRQAGRPPTKRIRKRSKTGVTIKCSNCTKPGHNRKTCPEPIGLRNIPNEVPVNTIDTETQNVQSREDTQLQSDVQSNNRAENTFY